ncbi:low molecular weight phosphatase family protein [Mycolicibacterium sp. P1-18]|nr:low molecular weight phosphatase family protein [Mycolicibacterium sp. P1-18]KAA0099044.1 low molecular weight phosphatase family protein [Mycolicibacterium sp. P1-18]
MHILFVCTGNICRSPTAERLAVMETGRLGINNLSVSSAGTHAVVNHPIHPHAAQTLRSLGGDASNFGAKQLTPKIAAHADLIITMTNAHRDSVLTIAPRKLKATFTLGEVALLVVAHDARRISDLESLRPLLAQDQNADVPDPLGKGPEYFDELGEQIAKLVKPVLSLCRYELLHTR